MSGKIAFQSLLLTLINWLKNASRRNRKTHHMKITRKTIWIFKRRLVVIFVRNSFTKQNYNVTDHCHRTGEYRREAYNMCNINIFSNKYLPVFFHNLKGCDGHLIRREGLTINQDMGDDEISAIPNSNEKYIRCKIGEMTFIHFYAFLCDRLINLSRTYTTRKFIQELP